MRFLWKMSFIVLVISFPFLPVGCSGGSYMSEDAATIPADQEDDPDEAEMMEEEEAEEE